MPNIAPSPQNDPGPTAHSVSAELFTMKSSTMRVLSLVSRPFTAYNSGEKGKGEKTLQIDDRLKRLLRELGHAINDTVSESDRITEAISGVRAAGYDIVLKLDATIGLARRESNPSQINSNDRRFLESLHIQVDQDVLEEEKEKQVSKLEVTAQDLRFLKSLKISFDEPKA